MCIQTWMNDGIFVIGFPIFNRFANNKLSLAITHTSKNFCGISFKENNEMKKMYDS